MLILKIAWRNILRHRGKSLVVGFILFLGAMFMTLGNSAIIGAQKGIEHNLIDRFTGSIVLVSRAEEKTNVFFTPLGKSLKVINNYPAVEKVLAEQDYLAAYLPLTRGIALVVGLTEDFWPTFVIGCNFEDYQRVFLNNIQIIEGSGLKNGEKGVLISHQSRDSLYRLSNVWLIPVDTPLNEANLSPEARQNLASLKTVSDLVFVGWGEDNFNTDIRLPVKGIIRYKNLDTLWAEVSFMDIESFRRCFGYITATENKVQPGENEKKLLEANPDQFFDQSDLYSQHTPAPSGQNTISPTMTPSVTPATTPATTSNAPPGEQSQPGANGETGANQAGDLDNGAYNLVALKLKPGVNQNQALVKIKNALDRAGVDAKPLTWQQATGQVAQLALIMQGALFVFVGLLYFVAIIIIMNTLSMAAIERTEELGMMRAVGAQKGFVSSMFFSETFLLSAIFGGLGIIIGIVGMWIFRVIKIQAGTNQILNLLFGGETFQPALGLGGLLQSIIMLFVVTVLATLYPLAVARRITPLDAINRT